MALTNLQYDDIRREYDNDRRIALQTADDHLKEVCSKIPEYKELSDQIASVSLEHTKKALEGDSSSLDDLKQKIAVLSSKKRDILTAAGYDEDYIKPQYKCRDCGDTGYIDGKKCHCFKLREISLLYAQSNLVFNSDDTDIESMSEAFYSGEDLEHFRETRQKAVSFINNFNSDYQNLLFYGTVGTGKSMLSTCIAKALLKDGHSVVYFSASTLIDELAKVTFGRGSQVNRWEDTTDENDPISNCELLIIDDLGTEITNNFTIAALFALLNGRALNRRSTIISTNLSLEELRDRYTDRIFSRLTGGFTLCRLSGPDIRIARKLVD